jgi:hypothetical protein
MLLNWMWSWFTPMKDGPPYLSLMDVLKLDDVRETLQREDVKAASKFGRVYRMLPIAV